MKELAFRTYDLTVDQIMEIVEKVGPEGETSFMYWSITKFYTISCINIGLNDKTMGLKPLQECGVMTGGRMAFFPELQVCL